MGRDGRRPVGHHGGRLPRPHGTPRDGRAGRGDDGPDSLRDGAARRDPGHPDAVRREPPRQRVRRRCRFVRTNRQGGERGPPRTGIPRRGGPVGRELPRAGPGVPRRGDGGPYAGRDRPRSRRPSGRCSDDVLERCAGRRRCPDDPPRPGARERRRCSAPGRSGPSRCRAASTRPAGTSRSSSSSRHQGARGVLPPPVEAGIVERVGDPASRLPAGVRRDSAPALPELAQVHVVRHYARLSQENIGVDLNIDVGQGTCTMKYSPKVNDQLVAEPEAGRAPPAPGPVHGPGDPRDPVAPRADALRDLGDGPGEPPARGRLGGDLRQRHDDPGLSRCPRRRRAARRGRHDDLQPPVERSRGQGRRLPGDHAPPGPGDGPAHARRAQGGGRASARRRSSSRIPRTRGSSTPTSTPSSGSSTTSAASRPTTRPTRTGSWGSPGPATRGSTCATSTCTRRSPRRTAPAVPGPARAASAPTWPRSCRARRSSGSAIASSSTTTGRRASARSGRGTARPPTSSGPTPGS